MIFAFNTLVILSTYYENIEQETHNDDHTSHFRPGGRHRRQVHHYIGFNNEEFASANDVVKADITQEGDTMIFRDTDGKANLEVSLVRGAAGNILQVSNPERESSG